MYASLSKICSHMKIGIPKEIKTNENRVSLTPGGALDLINKGHEVYVQTLAGAGSGFLDEEYSAAGAIILDSIEAVYDIAEMIIKVKEPIEQEYGLIKEGQIVFTYFHFASHRPLVDAMIKSKAICIAYETVENPDGSLPLLIPMSEVAGRMAVHIGANYLESPMGGKGILLGGVPGVKPAEVMIIGGGIVGTQAAKMASGMGANVVVLDINLNRLRYLEDILPDNVDTLFSSTHNIKETSKTADLIIGAVLIPGAKAPNLITRDMLKDIQNGTVLIDVAVDQGGCIETCKPTTHEDPIYTIDDVIHYCVANMPGAVPFTSTLALTNATLAYVLNIANKGWKQACMDNPLLAKGLNIAEGKIVYEAVADAFGMEYNSRESLLNV